MHPLWDDLCDVLTDFDYLQTRIGAGPSPLTVSAPQPPSTIFDLLRDFHRARQVLAAEHPRRQEVEALGRVIDQNSHVLKEDPSLLLQQVHNALVWDWDGGTGLGRRLAAAVAQYRRPWWFRRLSRATGGADPELLRILTGHRDSVRAAAFDQDGQTLVTVAAEGGLCVWDATTGELCKALDTVERAAAVGVAPQGQRVVVADVKGKWFWWGIGTGIEGCEATWPGGSSNSPLPVAVAHDAAFLATVQDGQVILWDTHTGKDGRTLRTALAHPTALGLGPDGKTLVLAGGEALRMLDLLSGEERPLALPVEAGITAVALAPGGQMLATAGDDWRVILWDLPAGVPRRILTGHRQTVHAVAFSPDGQKLVTCGADRRVIFWDLTAPAPQRPQARAYPVATAAFAPDGKKLASLTRGEQAAVWNVATGEQEKELRLTGRGGRAVAVAPGGQPVAGGGHQSCLTLWEAAPGLTRYDWTADLGRVNGLAFSPDGWLLAGACGRAVIVWGGTTAHRRQTLRGHPDTVTAVAFSPDGSLLGSGDARGTVILWDVHCGQPRWQWIERGSEVTAVTFSPDGWTLAAGTETGRLFLWDVGTGRAWPGGEEQAGIRALAFLPDNRTLVSGDRDGHVSAWDSLTGARLAWLPCPDEVLALCCPPGVPGLLVADAGCSANVPNIHLLEVVRR
jgi:WD40 repeat protein